MRLEVALVLAGEEGDLSSTVFAVLADVRREMGHVDEALKLYGKAFCYCYYYYYYYCCYCYYYYYYYY